MPRGTKFAKVKTTATPPDGLSAECAAVGFGFFTYWRFK
jgi:hypothetical protein